MVVLVAAKQLMDIARFMDRCQDYPGNDLFISRTKQWISTIFTIVYSYTRTMNLDAARDYIVKRMAKELSPDLHYHSIEHTFDVHHSCIELARIEGVDHSDLTLLETAAYFHDSGIIETYDNHEEASVRIAREILPQFGYTEQDLNTIEYIILKTKLPQSAITLLGEILCDSDLDYLGRPDFFMIAQRLRYEWELMGNRYGLKEWYEMQLRFLRNHKYYTRAARMLRDEGKMKNLAEIERALGK